MDGIKFNKLLYYCNHGWPIFPLQWMVGDLCSCGSSSCKSPGKHPLVSRGFRDASLDLDQIQAWHMKWPKANWGMRTGDGTTGGAGMIVIDIDAMSGGFETWDMLRNEHMSLIETVTVITGGGGQHLWFAYPADLDIRSSAGVLGPGIDIRANDGYVLVPPSRTYQDYCFLLNPIDTSLASCPDWILSKLAVRVTPRQLPAGLQIGLHIPQGARHQSLVRMAGSMRRTGMSTEEMQASLSVIRDKRFELGDHIVSDDEIIDVVDWVSQKDRSYALTDLGNAERFVELFGGLVRFCYELGEWLVWDGRRWVMNANAELTQMAHTTVRRIHSEAAHTSDSEQRKAISRHALASESQSKVEAMLTSAKPYLAVRLDHLDQHPMLLNVANGVIDLTTGVLLPHDPNYLITKLIDVVYDPEAKCPEWEEFLELVTGGDQDLQAFLQLSVGYSLTGSTDEHCLFVLYGTGANGKTTFTESLRLLFTDYARRINVESLLQSWSSGQAATPEVANLAGGRFVISSEIPESRKLNESLVKDLTGGDAITARRLFGHPFTFNPTHKLWIFGNHKPRVSGTDEGIWRRIRVVPFNITIRKEKRRKMSEVLQAFQKEMSGILAWAVKGCVVWHATGLPTPDAVQAATAEYRSEQDLVQQFLEEKCEMHVDYSIDKSQLYLTWRDWCEANGENEAGKRSKKWLTQQMTTRGYRLGGGQNRILYGIRMKE